jgi:hypothetical protein
VLQNFSRQATLALTPILPDLVSGDFKSVGSRKHDVLKKSKTAGISRTPPSLASMGDLNFHHVKHKTKDS